MISVIIIAKNEENNIAQCLKSVSFADEKIVIDSGSSDNTANIAGHFGAKVFVHDFKDFSNQRNFALSKSSGDWILYIDADERVTDNLRDEMMKIISSAQSDSAYNIPRQNIRLGGHIMHFGGWWPDYVTRLFKRSELKNWYGEVHESPNINGSVGRLANPLLHYGRDLNRIVEKTIEWSAVEARLLYKANHPPVAWWRLLKISLDEFFRRYIILQGFRDGTPGLIEAIYQSFSRFITYARLWELQQNNEIKT
ncbi:MAG: glycosyltransferase family 2 protein [Candidatus Gottesmanbacteria bacterium]